MVLADINLEKSLWLKGYRYIVGVDEVGRGPLAGPLVAGAYLLLDNDNLVEGVRDSKKIGEKKREVIEKDIKDSSSGWGIGVVASEDIDRLGITKAVNLAMSMAVDELIKNCRFTPDIVIIDGRGVMDIEGYECIKVDKGDVNHYSVACASIIAKVYRDSIMKNLSNQYSNYGFERNMGYGTKEHIDAIHKFGICSIHRRSFEPVKSLL